MLFLVASQNGAEFLRFIVTNVPTLRDNISLVIIDIYKQIFEAHDFLFIIIPNSLMFRIYLLGEQRNS